MRKNEKGFTLVELAIVLMIIGLLIAGVLRGQEILNTARMNATIRQVQGYAGAVSTFQDAYAMLPGDMRSALARLPGCNAASNCVNGDGNGVVGVPVMFWIGGQQAINTENTQFWKHLALTHIISGVNPVTNSVEWGESHPAAPEMGGFTIIATQGAGEASFPTGTLVLRAHGDLNNASNIEEVPSLSPKQAGYIDRKADDGIPLEGNIRSKANGNGAAVASCEAAYVATDDKFCVMAFVMNL